MKNKKWVWIAVFAVLGVAILVLGYLLIRDIIILENANTDDEIRNLKDDIKELKQINPDVVGWITVDGTNIDYPLLHGQNNMMYVSKDIYGQNCLSGSIFLDSTNALDDPFLLIYGHHMEAGKMFGDVEKYLDESFFAAHRNGELVTEDSELSIDFFAFLVTDANDKIIFRPKGRTESEIIDHVNTEAMYKRDITVSEGDQIVALSTCGRDYDDQRYILLGIVKGEDNEKK